MLPNPINLQGWIDEHRHLLKPPVGNKCIVDGDYIVMIVGGPNARTDYHFEDGPEYFHQLEGEMVLRIQEGGAVRDIPIKAGEMFYLPPHGPHSPQRMPGSIGLVIERKRLANEDDALMWFCVACNHKLYEEFFHLVDIEQDPSAAEKVAEANGGNQTVPTLLFSDGSTLTNPSVAQVKAKLADLA